MGNVGKTAYDSLPKIDSKMITKSKNVGKVVVAPFTAAQHETTKMLGDYIFYNLNALTSGLGLTDKRTIDGEIVGTVIGHNYNRIVYDTIFFGLSTVVALFVVHKFNQR